MKIVTAMMKHETNTFSPLHTDWARFEAWGAYTGPDVIRELEHTRMPIAAYMRLARERGYTIEAPIAAEAMPSGPVESATYEYMCDLICEAIQRGCDAALLDLHGAMVVQHAFDGEGTLLERIRHIAPELPIAVTCDLHCNLTEAMVDNCTALIGYKTYPHTDMYEVASQVGTVLFDALEQQCRPTTAWQQIPLLSQTLCQGTADEPMRSLIERCRDWERREGVLAATIFGGFALADIPDAGSAVIVITDNDESLAREVVDDLVDRIWNDREDFIYKHHPIDHALADAKDLSDGPVILLDHADNCGSGGTQDVMTVIEQVLDAALEDVIVAAVWDPDAVRAMQAAGVGNSLTLELGGKTDMPSIGQPGRPLRISGRVKTLSDGRWQVRGPMYTGVWVDMGPSAVLETDHMQIVIVSNHHEPWDVGVFTSLGIQPEQHRYILLKSRIHYRAGFGEMPKHTLTLDGTGVTTSDMSMLDYQNVRHPIYPLDRPNAPQRADSIATEASSANQTTLSAHGRNPG
jgi:microcystin degradation protein MlrC